MTFLVRAHAPREPMHDQLPTPCRRHVRVDGLQRPSGRTATSPSGNPITIMSPTPVATPESRTEISMGTRAHTTPIAPARRLSSAPRSALRAALRGDRAPPLALDHNEVAGGPGHLRQLLTMRA